MAYHIQSSFAAGELDPALHERTTFDKYQSGLATLRNAVIGKTGRIVSRPGTMYFGEVRDATPTGGVVTVTGSPVSAVFTLSGHGFGPGTPVRFTSTGSIPGGLSESTTYYVCNTRTDTFNILSSYDRTTWPAELGAYISSNGSGTISVHPQDMGSKKAILYSPPYTDYLIEIGHLYLKLHNLSTGATLQNGHRFTEDDLESLTVFVSGTYLYLMKGNISIHKFSLTDLTLTDPDQDFFDTLPSPTPTITANSGTGYRVDYAFTVTANGEESNYSTKSDAALKTQITPGEVNTFTFTYSGSAQPSSLNVYRRPYIGSAYGYIGSVYEFGGTTGAWTATFSDFGNDADYAHSPPEIDKGIPAAAGRFGAIPNPYYLKPQAGCVYQQKLVIGNNVYKESIHASRTSIFSNFMRDYPLSPDGALTFKCGTSGYAQVLHLMDSSQGLLIFTTIGIFRNSGPLSPENLATEKVGSWVIDNKVPPIEIPGGIIFVDKTTNTVRTLIYSNEAGGFPGEEISIFSNHLFLNKNVVSWAFQDGDIPVVWCVMDDGTLNVLTFMREHKMQAWSHCDTEGGLYESVTVHKSLDAKSVAYFIVNRNGTRLIEYTADRFVDNIKEFVGMDSAVTYNSEISSGASVTITPQHPRDWKFRTIGFTGIAVGDTYSDGTTTFTVRSEGTNTPYLIATSVVDAPAATGTLTRLTGSGTASMTYSDVDEISEWEGELDIESDIDIFTDTEDNGAQGTTFRFFDSQGSKVDLVVTNYVDTKNVTVVPRQEFPSDQSENITLYKTYNHIDGLGHLEGKIVAVMVDGYVVGSPNNDIESYREFTVRGGAIDLPSDMRGAFVHVGLPITVDIETLDVDTVEQKPTLLESKLVNNVFLKIYNTRGVFIGTEFQPNNSVYGMTDPETREESIEFGVIGNAAQEPETKRHSIAIRNEWKSEGRICIRQVDPLPMEILSIIPDMTILT